MAATAPTAAFALPKRPTRGRSIAAVGYPALSSLGHTFLLKLALLGLKHLLQSLDSLPTPICVALAGRNHRLRLANHATEICDVRVAEVAVMQIGTNGYAASTSNLGSTRVTVYFSHARFLGMAA